MTGSPLVGSVRSQGEAWRAKGFRQTAAASRRSESADGATEPHSRLHTAGTAAAAGAKRRFWARLGVLSSVLRGERWLPFSPGREELSCLLPSPGGAERAAEAKPAMLRALRKRWQSYKYRFVPWIALNLRHKRRTLRFVPEESKDKIVSDEDVLQTLLKVFRALFVNDLSRQTLLLNCFPHVKLKYLDEQRSKPAASRAVDNILQSQISNSEDILFNTLGFSIARRSSSLVSAGTGVFVTKGFVPKGTVVAMYPGTVYEMYEPIFFQSIGNPFIFRCIDGVLIDGNDRGISKSIYRSCSRRDQIGPLKLSDVFWLTTDVQNPLAVGQYVNNCSADKAANVCYQEFDVPESFPIELRQYLPNINYSQEVQRSLRCVVLVALRDIETEEELFSNYYTIVH